MESATAMAVLQRDENWMSVAKFDVRRTRDIGYGDGCGMAMETLMRRVRLDPQSEKTELEADMRHVSELVKTLNMENLRRLRDTSWTTKESNRRWIVKDVCCTAVAQWEQ